MIFRPPRASEAPPWLSVSPANPNVSLAWPTHASGFRLQEATSISAAVAWVTVSDSVVVANGSNYVTLPFEPDSRYFRLAKP